jgi:agmatine/peptidylarginine deiminase
MKKLLFLALSVAAQTLFAQDDHRASAQDKALMPQMMWDNGAAAAESVMGQAIPITTPPTFPVRAMAEWEELQALTITWTSFPDILAEIVRNARLETRVIITCSDSNAVKNTLTSKNIPLTNIAYSIAPFDRLWCRDYGANPVYRNGVDSLLLVDWKYNRPTRTKDDVVPNYLADKLGLPIYATTVAPNRLIHTGGNFMSDGFGTAFSSKLVLEENPALTESQVDTIMKNFMGISRYIKMDTLPFDGIHHIDMHMKLIDEETLLVGEYPAGVADGPQIEANLQYVLANFPSKFGTPYKVIRIPQPPDAAGDYPDNFGDYCTYANAVFVNKSVLLPIYRPQYDTTALRIWREALPGYKIVGINCNSIIPQSGAIHCITHSVGVADPLLISHQAVAASINVTAAQPISAYLAHRSGIASATVYFTTDTTQAWQSLPMTYSGTGNNWTATLPGQAFGTTVYYYISATANSGKQQVRPMPAPKGWWRYSVNTASSVAATASRATLLDMPFPNPAAALTCIPVQAVQPTAAAIRLLDVMGREVQTIFNGILPAGTSRYFFQANGLTAGMYVVEMRLENGDVQTQRVAIR